jgi:predicted HAD superfamily Cof-like phosphohydrolase
MKKAMEMVAEFHRKHGMPRSDVPRVTDDFQRRVLRLALLREELDELMNSLGIEGDYGEYIEAEAPDIIGVADALGDLLYLVIGSAVEWGIPLDLVLEEVHRSNMTKQAGNVRGDGKILKGPEFSPPDLAPLVGR